VGELIDLMSERGIAVKVSGIAEWIHYLDFVRNYALNKLLKLEHPAKRWFSKPARDLAKLHVEKWWKHSVEKKVLSILEPTGLIPETPHDMDIIMQNTQEHFVNLELNSEIAVSSGVAATAMQHGYSGIVNISPFACLIGRVIEGLFAPWARERNYPTLSVEIDGNLLPPNIINKLNIFMVNVLRFKGNQDLSSLVDKAGAQGVSVTGHMAALNDDAAKDSLGGRKAINVQPLSMESVSDGDSLVSVGADRGSGCSGCSGCS
jgi:predicted nucleotide-binding protein (sugar kinase/HSP70/actin superfamily)